MHNIQTRPLSRLKNTVDSRVDDSWCLNRVRVRDDVRSPVIYTEVIGIVEKPTDRGKDILHQVLWARTELELFLAEYPHSNPRF